MAGSEQADLFSAIGLRGVEEKRASQGAECSDAVGRPLSLGCRDSPLPCSQLPSDSVPVTEQSVLVNK